jgi:carnitine O-acetyltransferase
MADPSVDDKTRVDLFRKAIDSHLEYISAASDGKGVDRHLFGLKKLVAPGEELPALFKDPAYAYSSSWFLSTSQLSSEYFNGYGWSQVIDAGFGIAYMINENRYVPPALPHPSHRFGEGLKLTGSKQHQLQHRLQGPR